MRSAFFVVAAAALFLSGCAARIDEGEAGPRPVNYRETLRAYISKSFFDPYSMRDTAISEPVPGRLVMRKGWIVCFQTNAKNRFGAYVGLEETSYLFQGEDLVEAPGEKAIACEGVPLLPWPGMR